MNNFRRLAFLSTLATYFLIFMGGLVRVSGAGLGCPDWPKCFGRWIPPLSPLDLPSGMDPTLLNVTLAWIEYINRLSGVLVGLLILTTAIWALVRYRQYPRVVYPSLLAALLTAYQGWQGSRVVASELKPLLVSAHLVIAFIIASLMIYVVHQSYQRTETGVSESTPTYPQRATLWVALLWIGGIIQIVFGTQVRSGVEIAGRSYPLLGDLQWLNRVGAAYDIHMVFGILMALVTWVTGFLILKQSQRPARLVRQAAWGLMLAMLAQVIIGFTFAVSGFSAVLQLFHLWIAGLFVGLALALLLAIRTRESISFGLGRGLTHVIAPITATVIIAATIAFLVTGRAEASRADIPVLYKVPDFTFVERSGQPFGLDNMKGKINVVDFFFASCQGPCPIMNADMAEMYRLYAHSDKVQFVSFTVDPETDSLTVLRQYAERFGVNDNRWLFVRAETKVISDFCEQGFKVSGELPGRHSTKLILVDPQGMIRGYYDYDSETSLKLLRNNIRTLAREME